MRAGPLANIPRISRREGLETAEVAAKISCILNNQPTHVAGPFRPGADRSYVGQVPSLCINVRIRGVGRGDRMGDELR
jgi:hypothetical protein